MEQTAKTTNFARPVPRIRVNIQTPGIAVDKSRHERLLAHLRFFDRQLDEPEKIASGSVNVTLSGDEDERFILRMSNEMSKRGYIRRGRRDGEIGAAHSRGPAEVRPTFFLNKYNCPNRLVEFDGFNFFRWWNERALKKNLSSML